MEEKGGRREWRGNLLNTKEREGRIKLRIWKKNEERR